MIGVFIFLNIAMFVVKLSDLIPNNKSFNRRFLQNECSDAGYKKNNKTSSGEDHLRV